MTKVEGSPQYPPWTVGGQLLAMEPNPNMQLLEEVQFLKAKLNQMEHQEAQIEEAAHSYLLLENSQAQQQLAAAATEERSMAMRSIEEVEVMAVAEALNYRQTYEMQNVALVEFNTQIAQAEQRTTDAQGQEQGAFEELRSLTAARGNYLQQQNVRMVEMQNTFELRLKAHEMQVGAHFAAERKKDFEAAHAYFQQELKNNRDANQQQIENLVEWLSLIHI